MRAGLLCELLLFGSMGVDGGTILRADIIPLTHALGGIVVFPECLQQIFVGRDLGVEDDFHDFGVAGVAAAYLLVRRIRRVAAGVAHRRGYTPGNFQNSFSAPQKQPMPNTASCIPAGNGGAMRWWFTKCASGTASGVVRPGSACAGPGMVFLLLAMVDLRCAPRAIICVGAAARNSR